MTLALHGKSPRRRAGLVAGGVGAMLLAAVAALLFFGTAFANRPTVTVSGSCGSRTAHVNGVQINSPGRILYFYDRPHGNGQYTLRGGPAFIAVDTNDVFVKTYAAPADVDVLAELYYAKSDGHGGWIIRKDVQNDSDGLQGDGMDSDATARVTVDPCKIQVHKYLWDGGHWQNQGAGQEQFTFDVRTGSAVGQSYGSGHQLGLLDSPNQEVWVTEQAKAGYQLTGFTVPAPGNSQCEHGDAFNGPFAAAADVPAGGWSGQGTLHVCAYNKTTPPARKLILNKAVAHGDHSLGTSPASAFTVSISGAPAGSGAGSTSVAAAIGGTYTLGETGPAGFTLVGYACDSGLAPNAGHQITVPAGVGDITCTVTNQDPQEQLKAPAVSKKSGGGTYDQTYGWGISKSVDQAALDLGVGGSGSSHYTVTVTRTGPTNSNFAFNGTITVTNPNATYNVHVTSVSDPGATVVCPGGVPFDLPPSAQVVCSFIGTRGNADQFLNVATVGFGQGESASAQAPIQFVAGRQINATAAVTDSNPGGPNTGVSGTRTFQYEVARTCEGIEYNPQSLTGSVVRQNTATVYFGESSEHADAFVVVTCHLPKGSLQVGKTVNWQNWPASPSASFRICVSGPSLSECDQYTAGQVRVFTGLLPGTYAVAESDPGPDWTVSGSGVSVSVTSGGAASATVTNTHRRAFVTLNAHKTETSGAGSFNGQGWVFTISGCGASGSKVTDVGGNVVFGPMDLVAGCVYTVAEAGAPGWTALSPVQTAVFASPDGVQTLFFTNVKNEPGCLIGCGPAVTPTAPAQASPTATATPPTAIPPPAGNATPTQAPPTPRSVGAPPTPIAPNTGNGGQTPQAGGGGVGLGDFVLLTFVLALALAAVAGTARSKRI
jgi:hypothetical protein